MASKLEAWLKSRERQEPSDAFRVIGLDFGTGNTAVSRFRVRHDPDIERFVYELDRPDQIPGDTRRKQQQDDVPSECAYHPDEDRSPKYGEDAQCAAPPYAKLSHLKRALYMLAKNASEGDLALLRDRYRRIPYLQRAMGTSQWIKDRAELWPAADFLSWIVQHVTEHKVPDYFFFVSIPSVFSTKTGHKGLQSYLQVLRHVGLRREQFDLIEEVECAAHSCLTDPKTKEQITKKLKRLHRTVVFLDAGAGTTDMATYEVDITGPLRLSEKDPPTAVLAGPVDVLEGFEEWFRSEVRKRELRLSEHVVARRLLGALPAFQRDFKTHAAARQNECEYRYELNLDDMAVLPGERMRDLFDPWIESVKTMISQQNGDICVVLGGGSNSAILLECVQKKFGVDRVIVPDIDHCTSVAAGSVRAGLESVITSRKSFAHVGWSLQEDYDPKMHKKEPRKRALRVQWSDGDKVLTRQFCETIRLCVVRGETYGVGQLTGEGQKLYEQFGPRSSALVPGSVHWTSDPLQPEQDTRGCFLLPGALKDRNKVVSKVVKFQYNFEEGGPLIAKWPDRDAHDRVEIQWWLRARLTHYGIAIMAEVAADGRWDGPDVRSVLMHELHRTDVFEGHTMSLGPVNPGHLRYSGPVTVKVDDLRNVTQVARRITRDAPYIAADGAFVTTVAGLPELDFDRALSWEQPQYMLRTKPGNARDGVCQVETEQHVEQRVERRLSLQSYVQDDPFTTFVHSVKKRPRKAAELLRMDMRLASGSWRTPSTKRFLHGLPLIDSVEGISDPHELVALTPGVVRPMQIHEVWLCSANLVLAGHTQTWLTIPPRASRKFEDVIRPLLEEGNGCCSQFIRHRRLICTPAFLQRHQIPYHITHCNPGDLMITLGNVYHQVIDQTCSISETLSFTTEDWPPLSPPWSDYKDCEPARCRQTGAPKRAKEKLWEMIAWAQMVEDARDS